MRSKIFFLASSLALSGCLSFLGERGDPECGDGILTTNKENRDGVIEACDDSNNTLGDGCNVTCAVVEPGFVCFPDPLCVDCFEGGACLQLEELCDNDLDDDQDGDIDCADSDCNQVGSFFVGCAEGPLNSCSDSKDNDLNGATDCADQGCINNPGCPGTCGDGAISFGEVCDGPSVASCAADCQTIVGSAFVSAADIKGDQPNEATTVIFGEAPIDLDGDGINEARGYLVISSDNANECALFDLANGGQTGDVYVDAVFAGTIVGTRVFTSAIVFQDPGVASAGDFFVGDSDVNGDGLDDAIVDAGFIQNVAVKGICNDGTVLAAGGICNDTTFGGNSDGIMTISSVGATIDGAYSGFQQIEFSSNTQNLNIGFNAAFRATRCLELEDQLQTLLSATFGFQ